MPDVGQVRMAAYRTMREFGLAGTTIKEVRKQMKANGAVPGSDRDLPRMVRAFKDEQRAIAQRPPALVRMTETFITEIWQLAVATVAEIELQRGGAVPEPKKPRRGAQPPPRGTKRITVLQKAVEFLLRPDGPVREPQSAIGIYRLLTDTQAALTDEDHISRDLQEIEKRSKLLYRRQGKWWRSDRDYGDARATRRYVPRGTPLSNTRVANRKQMEDAIAFMVASGRPVSVQEIIHKLKVPVDGQAAFRLMLRNHLRAETCRRFNRDADGNFYV